MKLIVSSRLSYELDKPTDFVFQVHVAMTPTQFAERETFTLSNNSPFALAAVGDQNRIVRARLLAG